MSQKRYRYTGKEKDEESGLYYHGARYYAPWLGRWTAADPIGMKAGINRFSYVRNGPTGRVDPTGTTDVTIKPADVSMPTPELQAQLEAESYAALSSRIAGSGWQAELYGPADSIEDFATNASPERSQLHRDYVAKLREESLARGKLAKQQREVSNMKYSGTIIDAADFATAVDVVEKRYPDAQVYFVNFSLLRAKGLGWLIERPNPNDPDAPNVFETPEIAGVSTAYTVGDTGAALVFIDISRVRANADPTIIQGRLNEDQAVENARAAAEGRQAGIAQNDPVKQRRGQEVVGVFVHERYAHGYVKARWAEDFAPLGRGYETSDAAPGSLVHEYGTDPIQDWWEAVP